VEIYKAMIVSSTPSLSLHKRRPGVQLHNVGTEAELRRRAERLGFGDSLKIAPIPVDRPDEMARLLARAVYVVMLSEYESHGLAIQEALALGCPLTN